MVPVAELSIGVEPTVEVTRREVCSRRAWLEVYEGNGLVTDCYIRSIGAALHQLGFFVEYVTDCSRVGDRRRDVYFVAEAKRGLLLGIEGYRNVIYWAQGIAPEEDYLRFAKTWRRSALSLCERVSLRRAARVFIVSHAMLRHFELKYRLNLSDKSYIMPCCNETMHPKSFLAEGKYSVPVFAYAGGLSRYQCIDRMLGIFGEIQSRIPQASLLFYTWDVERARRFVKQSGIINVTVENKSQDELPNALAQAKYGFVIRDDIIVNRVATPTKISTYMSNGVIPIVSSCVEDFAKESSGLAHVICCEDGEIAGRVIEAETRFIDSQVVLEEYERFFARYFDLGAKRDSIADFLSPFVGY